MGNHTGFPKKEDSPVPAIGFGTWNLQGQQAYEAVAEALKLGIRHIDTAESFHNEDAIGEAIANSGVPRSDLFITTKASYVSSGAVGLENFVGQFMQQLQALKTDYVDCYLLHEMPNDRTFLSQVWALMEQQVIEKRVRYIGVSNAEIDDLEYLRLNAKIQPSVVQNMFKVYKPGFQMLINGTQDLSVKDYCLQNGITFVGYSIVNRWPGILNPLADPHVVKISQKHRKTSSQILLRWALQHSVRVIPRSSQIDRIRENKDLESFKLSELEMHLLDSLGSLSESSGTAVKPAWLPDVHNLTFSTKSYPELKLLCPGIDPSSSDVGEKCWRAIWGPKGVGCSDDLFPGYGDWQKGLSLISLFEDGKQWATLEDKDHRMACYGKEEL